MADMLHDWVLTFCVLCALVAVISPIMFVYGLKNGAIETLRSRLLDNPINREIRPLTNVSLPAAWFQEISQRPDVQCVIPTVDTLGSTAKFWIDPSGQAKSHDFTLLASPQNDPILLENHAKAPNADNREVVLTVGAAQLIGAQRGSQLILRVSRGGKNGEPETAKVKVTVADVADTRVGNQPWVYASPDLVEDIESYKNGFQVNALKWPGIVNSVAPVFDQVVIIVNGVFSKSEQKDLLDRSGLTTMTPLSSDDCESATAVRPGLSRQAYRLEAREHDADSVLDADIFNALKTLLPDKGLVILPICNPIHLNIGNPIDQNIISISILPAQAALIPLSNSSLQNTSAPGSIQPPPTSSIPIVLDSLKISPPPDWSGPKILIKDSEPATLMALFPDAILPFVNPKPLHFPVSMVSQPGLDRCWAPADFVGSLRAVETVPAYYDSENRAFIYARRNYSGFRIYARSIDDVEELREWFKEQQIEVITKAKDINEVKSLDEALTQLFLILATVGTVGAAASLTASLCSAVIRQKRELSVLKLLGLGTFPLLIYPLAQAMTLATLSFFTSWALVLAAGRTADYLFRDKLEEGESILHLAIPQMEASYLLICAISLLASFAAGVYVLSVDIAEGIRDE